MTRIIVIEKEEDDICEECGKLEETRPYGEGGKRICYDCAMKDEEKTSENFKKLLFGDKDIKGNKKIIN